MKVPKSYNYLIQMRTRVKGRKPGRYGSMRPNRSHRNGHPNPGAVAGLFVALSLTAVCHFPALAQNETMPPGGVPPPRYQPPQPPKFEGPEYDDADEDGFDEDIFRPPSAPGQQVPAPPPGFGGMPGGALPPSEGGFPGAYGAGSGAMGGAEPYRPMPQPQTVEAGKFRFQPVPEYWEKGKRRTRGTKIHVNNSPGGTGR